MFKLIIEHHLGEAQHFIKSVGRIGILHDVDENTSRVAMCFEESTVDGFEQSIELCFEERDDAEILYEHLSKFINEPDSPKSAFKITLSSTQRPAKLISIFSTNSGGMLESRWTQSIDDEPVKISPILGKTGSVVVDDPLPDSAIKDAENIASCLPDFNKDQSPRIHINTHSDCANEFICIAMRQVDEAIKCLPIFVRKAAPSTKAKLTKDHMQLLGSIFLKALSDKYGLSCDPKIKKMVLYFQTTDETKSFYTTVDAIRSPSKTEVKPNEVQS